MTNSLNNRQFPNRGRAHPITASRIAGRRVSRTLSSGDTVRLDSQSHSNRFTRDPKSYVTRPMTEIADQRSVTEVHLRELRASDSLTIQTERSTYTFLVIDPVERAGVLTGGKLKRSMLSVILIGVRDERGMAAGPARDEPGRLRLGAQAVFYLRAEEGIKRLTTSTITNLVHVRGPR